MNHETIPLLSGGGACSSPGDAVPRITGVPPADALTSSATGPIQNPRWLNLVLCFVGLFMLYDAGVFTFSFLLWQGRSIFDVGHYGGGFLFLRQVGALAFLGYVLYRRRRMSHGDGGSSAESRWLGTLEVALLLFVSFGVSIAYSLQLLVFECGIPAVEHRSWSHDVFRMLHSAAMVGAFVYVLYRGSRNVASIGLHWKAGDIAMALPLGIGGFAASQFCQPLGYWIAEFLTGQSYMASQYTSERVSSAASMPWLAFLFLNGFNEELIVRALLMTQVRKLTSNPALAITLSVAVQISYHFYQGMPSALGHIGWALLFSGYYWKTNRILPIVLAHNFQNFSGLLLRSL